MTITVSHVEELSSINVPNSDRSGQGIIKMISAYFYNVLDYRVIDGDSLELELDLGLDISIKEIVRLWGIDAPETRTRDLEEKALGLQSEDWLQRALDEAVTIQFHSKVYARGKYGRLLGDIYADGENLNVTMLQEGLAEPYGK
jgi:micrococcal nuclease